jgi:hypothetical protein
VKLVKRPSRAFERRNAVCFNLEVALSFAAALSGRLANPRRHEAFAFKALERGVHRANCR